MTDHTNKLLRGLRPSDAGHVDEVFPAEHRSELLAQITCEDRTVAVARRPRRGWPRRQFTLGVIGATTLLACAAIAAVLTTGSAVNPAPADAVSFRTSPNGDLLASVTDPFATRTRLNAAFAKQGLHITIRLIPVSPSAVGRVVYMTLSSSRGPQIKSLSEGHCDSGAADCVIGLRIPKGFTATATIGLGRPARPGETYESGGSAFASGELLHCSGLLGATVARTLPVLEHHKLTIQWMEDVEVPTRHSGVSSRARTTTDPPESYYIWGADLSSHGHIVVQIESKPWPATPGAGAHFNDGC